MIDTNSATWEHIKKVASANHEVLLKRIVSNGMNHDETQYLRGQLAAYKTILALPDIIETAPIIPTPYE